MPEKEYWCEVLNLYNKEKGELKRLLVCSNKAHNLVIDGIELSYKEKGYQLIKTETIGWVNDIVKTEFRD